jgi:hypothetical protein
MFGLEVNPRPGLSPEEPGLALSSSPAPKEKRMERIVISCMSVVLMGVGVVMVVWPSWAVLKSREDNDGSPPTAGEIWFMRLVGVGCAFGGCFSLYATLTGMPGADGPPTP